MDLKCSDYEGRGSALEAGSMFFFHGRKRTVLISYPGRKEA